MAVITKVLRMVFKNQSGSNFTISLDNPREDLTAAEIEGVMEQVIARNIFLTTGGELVSKYDIKIVDTTTNDLYEPA